jgi:hypothetical protein
VHRNDRVWKYTLVRAVLVALSFIYIPLVPNAGAALGFGAPVQPTGARPEVFAVILIFLLATWADAWLLLPWLFRRRLRAQKITSGDRLERAVFVHFYVRACVLYGGAPLGAALSFETHDPRYACLFAGVSALVILLLPRSKPPEEPAPPA